MTPTPEGRQRHHVTLFPDPGASGPLEDLRRRWDPVMAAQIAAHVTLFYPREAADPRQLVDWARHIAANQPPFRCRVGELRRFAGDEGVGCAFVVEDVDGGHRRLRSLVRSPDFAPGDVEPHVTVVHPRTSAAGDEAWAALAPCRLDIDLPFHSLAITAWNGTRWPTLATFPLTPKLPAWSGPSPGARAGGSPLAQVDRR